MRELLLLRHAKSSWADDELNDRDRPLSERGARDAALMAQAIAERRLLPDRILASPARRVAETLAHLRPLLSARTAIVTVDALYGGSISDYRAIIGRHGGAAARLMVVGHNPLIQATALALVSSGPAKLRQGVAAKYPTGALAVIAFGEGEWPTALAEGGRLAAFLRPRDLAPDAEED